MIDATSFPNDDAYLDSLGQTCAVSQAGCTDAQARDLSQQVVHALMMDGAPLLTLSGQINTSSSWPFSMPVVGDCHLN